MVCCRLTNDRKTKLAVKTELSFANSQLDLLKEELEGINSTFDVYQFDRCGIYINVDIMLGINLLSKQSKVKSF